MRIEGDSKLIASAFVKACGAMSATVTEDAKGNFGMYATLAAIVKATRATLAEHGLLLVQEPILDEQGLTIETSLLHESGAIMYFAPLTLPVTDRRPQAVGSAITYGRRYALAAICGLAPDDDDAQAAQDAQARPQQAKAPVKVQSSTHTQNVAPDAMWDAEPSELDKALIKLGELGSTYYGNEWEEQYPRLVLRATSDATNDPSKMTLKQTNVLITGLTKRLAEASTPK